MVKHDLGVEFKYLIVTDKDRSFGLSVNTAGVQSIKPNMLYPVSSHPSAYMIDSKKGRVLNEYQCVYIIDGEGVLSFENKKEIEISKGHLFVLFPGQRHSYHPLLSTGWTEYYIGFDGSIIQNIVSNLFFSADNQVIDVGINAELETLFARAVKVAESEKIGSQQYLSGIVLHILGLVLSISKNKQYDDDAVVAKIEQAKMRMNQDVLKKIEFEALAKDLGMSYSWFRKVFKECTGYSPAKYFQEIKLRKAKQMLVESSHSVKEIAYQLDYISLENFYALFKKSTGLTPLEYRTYGRKSDKESK